MIVIACGGGGDGRTLLHVFLLEFDGFLYLDVGTIMIVPGIIRRRRRLVAVIFFYFCPYP